MSFSDWRGKSGESAPFFACSRELARLHAAEKSDGFLEVDRETHPCATMVHELSAPDRSAFRVEFERRLEIR